MKQAYQLLVVLALSFLIGGAPAPAPRSSFLAPKLAGPYVPAALVPQPWVGPAQPRSAAHLAPVPADTSAHGLAGVLADVRRRQFFIAPTAGRGEPQSSNYVQQLTARYGATRYAVAARPDSLGRVAWRVGWMLRGIGRAGSAPLAAGTTAPDTVCQEARLTYRRPAYAVVYDNTPAGVRQTFVLAQRPAGPAGAPVRVALAVEAPGLRVRPEPGSLRFEQHGREVLRYTDLRAWDADGHPLPAHLAWTSARPGAAGSLALVVADAGARYPLTIDPLASTTASATLTGAAANDQFGYSVAGAGDVDGDGYGDVLVGAWQADGVGKVDAGAAYLYRGSAAGLVTTASTTLVGGAADDKFGISVAGAGDVNGDGYADVLVGAYTADQPGAANAGAAYLYDGSAAGLAAMPSATLAGAAANDQFGYSVAGVGDVDGDGYGDVLVGAYAADLPGKTDAGAASLYRGGAAGLNATASTTLVGAATNDQFGYSVSGAGDVDGDGYADVLIGAWLADQPGKTDAGAASLYRGGAAGLSSTATATLTGAAAGDRFGGSVAGVGDVDGDGYADVLIGAGLADQPGKADAGAASLYQGSAAGLSSTATTTLTGAAAGDQFGGSGAGAGDVDGDGYADILVAAPLADLPGQLNLGSVALYRGSAAGLSGTASVSLAGAATGDGFGISVAGVGDVNGDGYADVVIGALDADLPGKADAGAAYFYQGSAAGLSTTANATLVGAATGDRFGISVAGAGDVDGDGYADVLVGASEVDLTSTRTDVGTAYLYRGSAAGLSTSPNATLPGISTGDQFGISVAGVGDVDGDSYADVLVGAIFASVSGRGPIGAAYLFRGSAAGLSAPASATLAGVAQLDRFGISVAGAGDVDGDGYADVLVGASRADASGGRADAGAAYLYRGSTAGLATTPAATLTGAAAFDYFGISVAGVGDVNGDGYADVLIGAHYADSPGQPNLGAAYFYRGSAAGLSTSASASLFGEAVSDQFGISVAGAGDVNGDGYADVLVGANLADPNGLSGAGAAYLYRGSAAGLAATASTTLVGGAASDYFGASVAGAGDVNGDGYADALIGANFASVGTRSTVGAASLYRGNAGTGRRGNVRLYNVANLSTAPTPLSVANRLLPEFGLGLFARSAYGRVRARLVWEARANGQPFSAGTASTLTTSTARTGQGAWTTLAATGTELRALVSKAGRATRVRARLEYASAALPAASAAGGTGGVSGQARYGPWTYLSAQQLGQSSNGATPLPVAQPTVATAGLTAYPVPAHGLVHVRGAAPGAVLTLRDLQGRLVLTAPALAGPDGSTPLALPATLPAGLYLLGDGSHTQRLVVE